MDLKAYAEQSGKVYKTLSFKVCAWRVLDAVLHVKNDKASDSWRNLSELHASPRWLWAALVHSKSLPLATFQDRTFSHSRNKSPFGTKSANQISP